MTRDELRQALGEVLDERGRIDAETHRVHHDFVADRIECAIRRRAIFDAVVKHVVGWGVVVGVGWLGAQILKALRVSLQ